VVACLKDEKVMKALGIDPAKDEVVQQLAHP